MAIAMTANACGFPSSVDVAKTLKERLETAIGKLTEHAKSGKALQKHDSTNLRQLKEHAEKILESLTHKAKELVQETFRTFIRLFTQAHRHRTRGRETTIRAKRSCVH